MTSVFLTKFKKGETQFFLTQWKPGTEKKWIESYFLKAVSPGNIKKAVWLRFTLLLSKEKQLAESWAVWFSPPEPPLFLKQSFDITTTVLAFKEFKLIYPNSSLEVGKSCGTITKEDKRISWDLSFTTNSTIEKLFPWDLFYKIPFPKTKVVTLYPNELLQGSLEINNNKIELKNWPLMLGHNWGKTHTYKYGWFHCNYFENNKDIEFIEGAIAQNSIGNFVITPFLSVLKIRYKGKTYNFNTPKDWFCTKLFDPTGIIKLKGRWGELQLISDKTKAVILDYENPDSTLLKCYNNMFAQIEGRVFLNSKRVDLYSDRTSLEIGITQPPLFKSPYK